MKDFFSHRAKINTNRKEIYEDKGSKIVLDAAKESLQTLANKHKDLTAGLHLNPIPTILEVDGLAGRTIKRIRHSDQVDVNLLDFADDVYAKEIDIIHAHKAEQAKIDKEHNVRRSDRKNVRAPKKINLALLEAAQVKADKELKRKKKNIRK
mgnify:CR=1 FL=1